MTSGMCSIVSGDMATRCPQWPKKCSQNAYDHLCMMKVAEGAERQLLPSHEKFERMGWQTLRKL